MEDADFGELGEKIGKYAKKEDLTAEELRELIVNLFSDLYIHDNLRFSVEKGRIPPRAEK